MKAAWFVIRQPRLAPREPLEQEGHRSDKDGILVVTLRGTAYQRGFQHGKLLKSDLLRFRSTAWTYAPQTAKERLGVPLWVAALLTKPLLMLLSATYLPAISNSAKAEMQGMADGSGLPLREIVVQTVIWEVFAMIPSKPVQKPLHCSEFAFNRVYTGSGPLLGYNYDVLVASDRSVVDTFLALFVVEPTDGGAHYIAPNTIGSVGLNTGMNEYGVAFGWDNSYLNAKAQKGKSCTPYMLILRDIALTAKTVDDAVRRLQEETRPEADMSVLIDKEAIGVFECAGIHSTFRRSDIVWSCNRLQELIELDYCGAGRSFDARHQRYPEVTAAIAEAGTVTPADCVAILRDQGAPAGRQIAASHTTFSVLYDSIGQQIWVSLNGVPASHQPMRSFTSEGQRQPDDDLI